MNENTAHGVTQLAAVLTKHKPVVIMITALVFVTVWAMSNLLGGTRMPEGMDYSGPIVTKIKVKDGAYNSRLPVLDNFPSDRAKQKYPQPMPDLPGKSQ